MASRPDASDPALGDPRAALEAEVRAIATRLSVAGERESVGAFHLGSWTEWILDWALTDARFRTQLFRLVDVLPACRTDDEVLDHVEQYFDGVAVPRALELGIDLAEHVPLGSWLTARAARRSVRRLARQFIVGTTPDAALGRLGRLWARGEAATIDLLGEKVLTAAEADAYAGRLLELVDALVARASSWPSRPVLERDPWGPVPRVNLSVKPTALSPSFGPLTGALGVAEAVARLAPVLERARLHDVTVHLDTEHDEVKDLTFELLRRVGADYPDVQLGCVVQAYRRDAADDLTSVVQWSATALARPLQVRLVKGAYWDQERIVAGAAGWPVPVFETKVETDANYEHLTRVLVDAAGSVRPAIASHNLRSLAHALAYAAHRGLADDAVELQLLYGMAEPVHAALRALGRRVRVYAPIGELIPGMAYLVRRLLENTSNEGFVRQRFGEGDSLDELIVAPVPPTRSPVPSAVPEASRAGAPDLEPFRNEPHAELRRPGPRARLARAVSSVTLGFSAPVVIDGRPVPTGDVIESVDPGRPDQVVCTSGSAGSAEADAAMGVALDAWPAWRATPWAERAAVLFRAAALLRARRGELVALEVYEAGKPIPEADADVCEAIDFCEYYGREALRIGRGVPLMQAPGESNHYRYEPRGVGVVIAPWNFPLAIPTGMVVASLAAGNAVLFKPAEQTPGVASHLVDVLHRAGVPPGVLAFLPGRGEVVGAHLVEHPDTAFVVFTGSLAVGLGIVESAARPAPGQRGVKRVVAEMGGKNAVVVDADADLDVAVPGIVHSAFAYAGQKCSAASRVVVLRPRFEQLVERLVGAATVVPIGHPSELSTVCGPLIDADAHARVLRYRDLARREGEVVLARDDGPEEGWYVGPTVVVTRDQSGAVVTDEIFGPILTVTAADDFEEALALANDTPYALTAGIFSRSPVRIRAAVASLRAGNVSVNRAITGARVGRQPFGGFGLSGVGSKAGGPDYLLQFVEPRSVTENTVRQGFAPLEDPLDDRLDDPSGSV